MSDLYDITIVGGGPVGMFSAFYAGMRQVKTKIIESLPVLGGQVNLLYPEKKIYDIAGFPAITGRQLTEQLEKQMALFNTTLCLEEEVLNYEKDDDDNFIVTTSKGSHRTKTIVITAGGGAFQPRTLKLDGAETYAKKNLSYIVGNLESYRGKKVLINGGGDSAVDWALTLEGIADQVTLVHRRDKFRALDFSVSQLKASNVEIVTPYQPIELRGDGQTLGAITFQKSKSDKTIVLEADEFIINYGFSSGLGPLAKWSVKTNRNHIAVNSKMETSIPGIYAAGDIATYDGKIFLLATGFGEAPTAVNHAAQYIEPQTHLQPIQSTKLELD